MAKKKTAQKKRKPVVVVLTPEEKEKQIHRNEIRNVFIKAGFTRIKDVEDKEFTFNSRTGDIDDVFIYENIIVLAEYTISLSRNISTHLLKKKVLFDHINQNQEEFIGLFDKLFPSFKTGRGDFFEDNQYKIKILYASKNSISYEHKDQVKDVLYFDYPILNYFTNVTNAIKFSSRYELFKFLSLDYSEVGKESISGRAKNEQIDATVLPENYSNFPRGYKVVTFYISPESLLEKSYVLRKEGWRTEGGLYQRMINFRKISEIRTYLVKNRRVFINNLIVTLPSDTKILDNDKNTVEPNTLNKTQPVILQVFNRFDAIGLIDGQHRVYAYHEGGNNEVEISKLRKKQNLLVTGIIYPDNISDVEKTKFEASLFLEINSNQTSPKSELKQAIGVLLKPFATESIAKAVLNRLDMQGPLAGKFEKYSFDKDSLKTTSIVSYALVQVVKLSGNDSLFSVWDNAEKDRLKVGEDQDLLKEYIEFCTSTLNQFFGAIKSNIRSSRWSLDKNVSDKVLSVTNVNAFIHCLRAILSKGQSLEFDHLKRKSDGIDNFDFSKYKSSQYPRMGKEMFETYFEK